MVEINSIVGRHFKIISGLGIGGMGQVYKAQDINLGREVAIKFLHEEGAANPKLRERFLNEGKILATINHPCVISVFASDVDENLKIPFLVMEFVDGKSLDNFQDEFNKDPARFLQCMIDLLKGIYACHQKGIIHRDLKPQNILINKEGQLKIIDFGIAKTARKQTVAGVSLGTSHYMSPEQCMGKGEITGKTDVYATGIILWEFLTGNLPFDLETEADDPTLAIALLHLNEPPPLEELKISPLGTRLTGLLEAMLAKKAVDRPEIPSIIETLQRELGRVSGVPAPDFPSVPGKSETKKGQGAFIGGIYRIDCELGKGGMGRVYRALDSSLNRMVAIKVLNEQVSGEETVVERFIKEGKSLATIDHPNVLKIYASSRDQASKAPFLVMEYIDGVLLSALKPSLRKEKRKIAPLMLQLLEGIKVCHEKGIIHRDLKPSNLMVTRDGILKIFDFGIAKTAVQMTQAGKTFGTPQYMSPEQCTGDPNLGPKSDTYSIGIIFWELIFGETPFQADDGPNPELGVAMKQIQATLPIQALDMNDPFLQMLPMIRRMLDKDPARRPEISDIISKLDSLILEEFPETHETTVKKKKISHLAASGIKDLVVEASKKPSWGKPIGIFLAVAIVLSGFWFFSFGTAEDKRQGLVKTIKENIQARDFEAAAKNLALLRRETDGPLLARQFQYPIGMEYERQAVDAISRGEIASGIGILERVVEIDPDNSSAARALAKLRRAPPAVPFVASEPRIIASITESPASEPVAAISASETIGTSVPTIPDETVEITRNLDTLLEKFSGESDLQEIITQIDRFVPLGKSESAGRYRRRVAEKLLALGETLPSSEKNKALVQMRKAAAVFPGLPGLSEKIAAQEELIRMENVAAEKFAAAESLQKSIDEAIGKIAPPQNPTEILDLTGKLETEFLKTGEAGQKRKTLFEKYYAYAQSIKKQNPSGAIETLNICGKIDPGNTGLVAEIEALKADAAKQTSLLASTRKTDELKTKILRLARSPGSKEADRLPELFGELKKLSGVSETEAFREKAIASLKSGATKSSSLADARLNLEAAARLLPDDSSRKTAFEAETKKILEKKRGDVLAEFEKSVASLKPTPNAKPLLARFKEIGGLKEPEVLKRATQKVKTSYLSAAKSVAGKNPKRALQLLKSLQLFEGLAGDPEVLAQIETLGKKPDKTPAEGTETPSDAGSIDSGNETDSSSTSETPPPTKENGSEGGPADPLTELDRITSPELVEANVDTIIALTAKLEKSKSKDQARAFRSRAVNALLDIGDENGSQGAMEAAVEAYNKALKIIPNHPEVKKALHAVKNPGKPALEPDSSSSPDSETSSP